MPETQPQSVDRQSFLGGGLDIALAHARIGIVGLSGGGSHMVQQLAHIGFANYVLYDPQTIEDSNLHRLVGATKEDVRFESAKVAIAERAIRGLRPDARVQAVQDLWQNRPDPLRGCDIIFGCVDTFAARRELEMVSRRFRIPYIDIGMDVITVPNQPPRMAGQVILSAPDGPCMFCMGYLSDGLLTQEASRYGAVGGRPQVVWANGVLASSAIGMALDYLLAWTGQREPHRFLSFDGNTGTVQPDPRWLHRQTGACHHYTSSDLGDPIARPL